MAQSVLGKRTRASALAPLPSPLEKGRKRAKQQQKPTEFAILEDGDDPSGHQCVQVDVSAARRATPPDSPFIGSLTPITTSSQNETSENDENAQDIAIPQTPRRRDALCKQMPTTPRHRVFTAGTPFTPRTPRTPAASAKSIYSDARRVFDKGVESEALVGRDTERQELKTFFDQRLSTGRGGCLYVSGPPGTGKSVLVSRMCYDICQQTKIRHANVNCMSVKKPEDIYQSLMSSLDSVEGCEQRPEQALHDLIHAKSQSSLMLVVLDEIDRLLNIDMGVMYNLFEWSMQKGSKLILIGIANALDLTDRFLPRLKARNLKPRLLPFLPYSTTEIATILTTRARSLLPSDTTVAADYTPIVMGPAIQLVSKKVGAQNGDIRKAFDIMQRVIELVERETYETLAQQAANDQSPSKTPLGENLNLSSPVVSPVKSRKHPRAGLSAFTTLSAETAPRANLSHVIRITSVTFSNVTTSRLKSLNLQQKAVLCSLAALEHKGAESRKNLLPSPLSTPTKRIKFSNVPLTPSKRSSGPPTISAVFSAYSSLCMRDNILHPLSRTEFRDVIATLETLSLLSAVDGKTGSFAAPATPSKRGRTTVFSSTGGQDDNRISSVVDHKELQNAVEGIGAGVLSRMLMENLD
ncbi:MAG: AAA ATPase [Chrysothrix sp. TS-e1954]|nr:MAG: AAA ATPase [Chrysothrix sp. TS-e1954]